MQVKTNVKAGRPIPSNRCESVSGQPKLAVVETDELQSVEGGSCTSGSNVVSGRTVADFCYAWTLELSGRYECLKNIPLTGNKP